MSSGFSEVLNFSFISLDNLKKLAPEGTGLEPMPVRIANPMSSDMEYLRTNFRYNLLTAFAANRRYEDGSIRLFEIGKVYFSVNDPLKVPEERLMVSGVMGGQRFAKSWQSNDEVIDFFDAKGTVENLFSRIKLQSDFKRGQDISLHPNKQAEIYSDGRKIGFVGEIHPKVLAIFEIKEPVFLLELDLTVLLPFLAAERTYRPIPKFPSVVRDLALIVDEGISHQRVKETLKGFPLVENIEIFDVYSGGQVPGGKKSLAYRISYRSPTHTLTDSEIDGIQKQIIENLQLSLGASLRS